MAPSFSFHLFSLSLEFLWIGSLSGVLGYCFLLTPIINLNVTKFLVFWCWLQFVFSLVVNLCFLNCSFLNSINLGLEERWKIEFSLSSLCNISRVCTYIHMFYVLIVIYITIMLWNIYILKITLYELFCSLFSTWHCTLNTSL